MTKNKSIKHIYECYSINNGNGQKQTFEKLFDGNVDEQVQVFEKFKQNLERRKKLMNN